MGGDRGIGIGLALACLVILGVLPVMAAGRPGGFDGLTFALWLTVWQLVSALPLFVVETLRGRAGFVPRVGARPGRTLAITLGTGAVFGVATFMYVVAAEKAGPVSAAIAIQAYPLFTATAEAIVFGKRKNAAEIGFTLLMIAALVYLVTDGTFLPGAVSWWSVFALGIPLLWTIAHLSLKVVLDTTPITPNQVTVTRLVVSGLFLAGLAVALGGGGAIVAAAGDAAFQRATFAMGAAYYVELLLWFYAIRRIDVSLASAVTVPAPAVTMLVAVLALGETVAGTQIVAMACIAAALYGLILAGGRKARARA